MVSFRDSTWSYVLFPCTPLFLQYSIWRKFIKWTATMYRALKPILWEVCSDAYTMFKIQHLNYGNGVRDFKLKWWHKTDAKRKEDAKRKADA